MSSTPLVCTFLLYSSIPKNLRSVVYCNAIKTGGEKEWYFVWQQYLASNTATEKNAFLDALACTREIWLLGQYLEWSIRDGSGIRKQDSAQVFGGVGRNEVGYYVANNFFVRKLEDIHT